MKRPTACTKDIVADLMAAGFSRRQATALALSRNTVFIVPMRGGR